MSTRATYQVNGKFFYIHYDGYPEGAAGYFYAMIVEPNKRGGFAERFLRANDDAEFTKSHDYHGDTEYCYDLDKSGSLFAYKIDNGGERKLIWSGDVADFVNLHGHTISGFSPVVKVGSRVITLEALMVEIRDEYTGGLKALEKGWTGNAGGYFDGVWAKLPIAKSEATEQELEEIRAGILAKDEQLAKACGRTVEKLPGVIQEMKKSTEWFARFYFSGAFIADTVDLPISGDDPYAVHWPEGAYAFTIHSQDLVIDGDDVYRKEKKRVGPMYYHPHSEVQALEQVINDSRATKTLVQNMKHNQWSHIVWSRFGDWPQPYVDGEHVVLASTL
jgi:hypothetical protein